MISWLTYQVTDPLIKIEFCELSQKLTHQKLNACQNECEHFWMTDYSNVKKCKIMRNHHKIVL